MISTVSIMQKGGKIVLSLIIFLMCPALRLSFGWKTLSFSLNVLFIPSLGFTRENLQQEREIAQ